MATLTELAIQFAQMLLNGGELDGARILSPASVKLMASDHLPDAILDDPKAEFSKASGKGFGLDFMVITDPARAGTLAGKGTYSWGGAAGTWFWIDPENYLFFLGMIHVLAKDAGRGEATQAKLFLDLRDRAAPWKKGDEEGLLGLAFHPRYRENGEFFVRYCPADAPRIRRVSRFRVRRDDANRADPASEEVVRLLAVDSPSQIRVERVVRRAALAICNSVNLRRADGAWI